MSLTESRAIYVDDNDPTIRYEGPWTPLEASQGGLGTVHHLTSASGTAGVSVNFTGTSIIASAITILTNGTTAPAATSPVQYTVNCIIDGESAANLSMSEAGTSLSTALCNTTEILTAGTPHTLDILLDFPSPNPQFMFFFDYFLVTPAQNQTLDGQENILFYAADPVIETTLTEADAGWVPEKNWFQTSAQGSQFTFKFTGIAVTWYGIAPENTRLNNSTATYTVDGGSSFLFGIAPNTEFIAHPELFTTQKYPYGDHTLHVVYQGNNGSLPLTLFGLIIQRVPTTDAAGVAPAGAGTVPPSTSTAAPGSVVSTSSTSHPPHKIDAAQLGGILGGVIAVFLIVTALIVYFLAVYRKRIRAPAHTTPLNAASPGHPDNGELVPDPFPFSGAMERREGTGKAAATFLSSGHDMDELPRTALLTSPSVQVSSGADASANQTIHSGALGSSESSQGHYNSHQGSIAAQVTRCDEGRVFPAVPPPSYTVK